MRSRQGLTVAAPPRWTHRVAQVRPHRWRVTPLARTCAQTGRRSREICRFKPSTVSRRFSVTAGFYRTCVIDGIMEHSLAEHVRRPAVPAESATLGFTHLQFEALLTAARESANPCDFALVAMLGPLGLRIFEATGADIADLGEEHGHRVLRVCARAPRSSLSRCRQRSAGPSTVRSETAHAGRSCSTAAASGWTGTRSHAVCGDSPKPPASRSPGRIRTCSATAVTTMLDAGVDLRDVQIAARHADPRTTMRYGRARQNLDRHPNYILAAYMASGT